MSTIPDIVVDDGKPLRLEEACEVCGDDALHTHTIQQWADHKYGVADRQPARIQPSRTTRTITVNLEPATATVRGLVEFLFDSLRPPRQSDFVLFPTPEPERVSPATTEASVWLENQRGR